MGRRWRKRNKNKNNDQQEGRDTNQERNKKKYDDDDRNKDDNPDAYELVRMGNFKMEAYYAYQGLHDTCYNDKDGNFVSCRNDEEKESERKRWVQSVKSILPAAFRIGNDVDQDLRERLEGELHDLVGEEMELWVEPKGGTQRPGMRKGKNNSQKFPKLIRKQMAPVRRVPFVPHAYQLSIDRQTLRRNDQLEAFHDWLKIQTNAGHVTRQETVSMIPPIVLRVEPHHAVLDMCAAPGSKTSQLVELVSCLTEKSGDPAKEEKEVALEPRGYVVANDSDLKRAYMLVHQLRRINSPALLVTSCDAQFFPTYTHGNTDATNNNNNNKNTVTTPSQPQKFPLSFDRVLCDVPCSGDGTPRKNPGIWKSWNQLGALGLHPLQLGIAQCGARLVHNGGYMCYSTCSLNPLENEAVVAALLRWSDGSMILEDPRLFMPGIIARPGWSTWKVLCEPRSKKQVKDFKKKFNAKMQAKRKQYQATQEGKQDEDDDGGNDNGENNEGNGDDSKKGQDGAAAADAATTTSSTADATDQQDEGMPHYKHRIYGPPSSWDKETLKHLVESTGLTEYTSFDTVPNNLKRRIRASCFPPTPEEAKVFQLHKSMRILPQDMDTGGFFVALLKKVAPLKNSNSNNNKDKDITMQDNDATEQDKKETEQTNEKETSEQEEQNTAGEPASPIVREPQVKRPKLDETYGKDNQEDSTSAASPREDEATGAKDEAEVMDVVDNKNGDDSGAKSSHQGKNDTKEPIRGIIKGNYLRDARGKAHADLGRDDFVPIADGVMDPLMNFYGLTTSPTFCRDQFMARACGDTKVLYFIARPIKTLIDRGVQKRITIVNSGLKAFVRNKNADAVKYRCAQEGVQYLAPHMTKRKFVVDVQDFVRCLQSGGIPLSGFSQAFQDMIRPLTVGSFVVVLKGFETAGFSRKLILVMWRCRGDALNSLVNKPEMEGMKSKLRAIAPEAMLEAAAALAAEKNKKEEENKNKKVSENADENEEKGDEKIDDADENEGKGDEEIENADEKKDEEEIENVDGSTEDKETEDADKAITS